MYKNLLIIACIFFCLTTLSQQIKSIQLRPLQENSFSAIVPLGTVLELSFDDLEADSKDYQYKIEHMTHDWQSSRLSSSQYIDGFDQNTIIDVTNSFNTLQSYSHYTVQIPNINTVITKSGNYLLSVLDSYDELVFTRRFVLYENATTIGVSVERSRNTKTLNTQQTVQFSVNHPNITINNPSQEINVVILKNNNWNEKITDIQPTFFKPNQLLYTYTNKTNFWGGNEYFYFDNKFIRNSSLNVVKVIKKDVYHHYLYPFTYNQNREYKYNPDVNGQFVIRTLEANDSKTEADYALMHFSVLVDEPFVDKDLFVYGAFNDFNITEENKMQYQAKEKMYTGEILLKQGFYNYTFATLDTNGHLNTNDVNGTFYQTENEYTVIIYYKPFGSFYERVIGIGSGYFNQNE
ncbi:type IX secretion system plug protein domain-containing protein [Polaribacter sp. L3A8]|uniref:type IX secretion system plug protein n=1 Tax=Polaribacter sp. L3A8 TaxID=2686361 RepID=UPI00131AC489|nr:type IX secretion system plug protein domain-containing protein [Polaribacter sp. L3A8]